MLEVDLEYPVELHDEHNEYPLAPEGVEVNGTRKLIPHLGGRKNYVVHHEALRQLLKYGLRITKIHRGIKFRESVTFYRDILPATRNLELPRKTSLRKTFTSLRTTLFSGRPWKMFANDRKFES